MLRLLSSISKILSSTRSIGIIVLCAFFLSGAAGLIHQVVWTRLLRLVMGNTVFSITTVLCAFMSGLALGSYLGGRIADRRTDHLRIFAILEGVIALYCLALPWLINGIEPLYKLIYQNTHTSSYVFSLIRFFFSGLLMLVPATFMGATLPVLTKFFVKSPEKIGWSVGTLYGINTFGAMLGAFSAGFFLIPNLGITNTIYAACVFNATVSLLAYTLYRSSFTWQQEVSASDILPTGSGKIKENKKDKKKSEPAEYKSENTSLLLQSRGAVQLILLAYGFAGFASLMYEITWTRILSMLIGSSTYAFSMMLTAFILGLGIGSTAFARFADRVRNPLRTLAIIEAGIGVSALVVVPVTEQLPFFVTEIIYNFIDSFWQLQAVEFGLIFLMMMAPTILMGMAFPLVNRIVATQGKGIGHTVGNVYGANTIGTIAGSFIGGFVLIPLMGIQHTIYAAVGINVAVGIIFWELHRGMTSVKRRMTAAMVSAVIIVAIAVIPPWSASNMSLGPFYAAIRLSKDITTSTADLKKYSEDNKILFYKEGVDTTVAVKQMLSGHKTLYVNAKPDASTSGDLSTQEMVAHLPLMLHPNPKSALVIGLASGISLSSAGVYPLEKLDCVEISPVMVEASHYFDDYNRKILNDPRVNLIIADGRNHLNLTDKSYDVIISEPSNPWIAGMADLFTREYFQLCKNRLSQNGVLCAWVQTYNIDSETFRSIVATFSSVFPNATLWKTTWADCLLIGRQGEKTIDYAEFLKRITSPDVAADLKRIELNKPFVFLSRQMMGPAGIRQLTEGAPLHTDDNALAEFNAPLALSAEPYQRALMEELGRSWEADLSFLSSTSPHMETLAIFKEKVTHFIIARGHLFKAYYNLLRGKPEQGIIELRKAADLNPPSELSAEFSSDLQNVAKKYTDEKYLEQAVVLYKELLKVFPDYAEFHYYLANMFRIMGKVKESEVSFSQTLALLTNSVSRNPGDTDAHEIIAEILLRRGKITEALNHFRTALKYNPDLAQVLSNMAGILASNPGSAYFNPQEAIQLAKKACELTSNKNPRTLMSLSVAYTSAGQQANAQAAARMALDAAHAVGDPKMAELIKRHLGSFK